jgi:hypothetical protein
MKFLLHTLSLNDIGIQIKKESHLIVPFFWIALSITNKLVYLLIN